MDGNKEQFVRLDKPIKTTNSWIKIKPYYRWIINPIISRGCKKNKINIWIKLEKP